MEAPKFNNVPNSRIQVKVTNQDGVSTNIDYWISRANAVVGVVFAFTEHGSYVLVTKRSMKMMDEKGKMCVPCGYLDWNETGYESVTREIYEETSLYLPDIHDQLIFNNGGKPFEIKDNPNADKRQNVSMLYVSVYDFKNEPDKFPSHIHAFTCHETESVQWMKLLDFYAYCDTYEWAFNHDETIKSALNYFNKNYRHDYIR
jgi:8-oxo-dGTP pyrophosphatase MutT (NUDIX family)